MVAQYPIAKDGEGRKGKTELELISNIADFVTGESDYFDIDELAWVDLIQLSSNTTNDVIDQQMMLKISTDDDVVLDYMKRVSDHLSVFDEDAFPCIYIAGKPPQKSFDKAKKMGIVQLVQRVSSIHHISMYRMIGEGFCDREFFALENRAHPSAHYHNQDSTEFKDTTKMNTQASIQTKWINSSTLQWKSPTRNFRQEKRDVNS